MADLVIAGILLLAVGAAAAYIIKAKKVGKHASAVHQEAAVPVSAAVIAATHLNENQKSRNV